MTKLFSIFLTTVVHLLVIGGGIGSIVLVMMILVERIQGNL